jgi:RimJ/RimL family protein N-acetyltransferase
MNLSTLTILTNRLLLQPIALKYKAEIFPEFTAEITTFLIASPAKVISETETFINKSLLEMAAGEKLVVVILKKDDQEFLGCSGIHNLNTKYPSLGIWLKKSAHGQGYGLEAITALKQWADDNLDCEYLTYPVDQANIPSRRIPEKLGGQIIREYEVTNMSGRVLNIVEYQIPKN